MSAEVPKFLQDARQLASEKLESSTLKGEVYRRVVGLLVTVDPDRPVWIANTNEEYSINCSRASKSPTGEYDVTVGFCAGEFKRTLIIRGEFATVTNSAYVFGENGVKEDDLEPRNAEARDLSKFKEVADALRVYPGVD